MIIIREFHLSQSVILKLKYSPVIAGTLRFATKYRTTKLHMEMAYPPMDDIQSS